MTVGATTDAGPKSYQWFKDDVRLAGETSSSLTVGSFDYANAGNYRVLVANADGYTLSRPASLNIASPLLLGWGNNGTGQFGQAAPASTNAPTLLNTNALAAAAGAQHTLLIAADGTLWTMGNNNQGQLGNGTFVNPSGPVSIAASVIAVAAGAQHSLYVTADGGLWAMGLNNYGQLGNGGNVSMATPAQVATDVVAVAAGGSHSLFLRSDGSLWAMGLNYYGQLGNGGNVNSSVPVKVATNVVSIAAGSQHSAFVTADGGLWEMGWNYYGQFGNGLNGNSPVPVLVATNVIAATAGSSHTLYLTADRTLWGMGWNSYGQLGNGGFQNAYQPVNIVSNVVTMTAGYAHSLYVAANGGLRTMGWNNYGQLGNGSSMSSSTPVAVNNVFVGCLGVGSQAYHSLAVAGVPASVALSNLSQVYDGTAKRVTATTMPPGLPVVINYNGVTNEPSQAGSYTVVATASQASQSVSVTNTFTITAAPVSVSVNYGELYQTYNGTARTVDFFTSPPGVSLAITYAGNPYAPTNAGFYKVIALVNDGNYVGGTTNYLVVSKANATVTLNNLDQNYDGTAKMPTAVTVPPGLVVNKTYDGNAAAPTDAGIYTVSAVISDLNYQGSTSETFWIEQATPSVSVWPTATTISLGHTLADAKLYGGGASVSGAFVFATPDLVPPQGTALHTVYFEPLDSVNYVTSQHNIYVTVTPAAASPVITSQPVGAVVADGQAASVSVTATSATAMGYQWYKDGVKLLGQTGSTLGIAAFMATNGGNYQVVITNDGGMTMSLPAPLSAVGVTLQGWGRNGAGQLGDGTADDALSPEKINDNVVTAAAGGFHSLFVTMDGNLWGMGGDTAGQLGDYADPSSMYPQLIADHVLAAAAGSLHSLYLTTNGTLMGMGMTAYGQLGYGATNGVLYSPAPVASNVVAAAAGGHFSTFVTADGNLWVVGEYAHDGSDGTNILNSVWPVFVTNNVVAVSAGFHHFVYLTDKGLLWACGNNQYGQLGNGTTTDSFVPLLVASNVMAAAAGGYHTLFVTTDGNLWSLGDNELGETGLLDPAPLVPELVATNVATVAAGGYHSLYTTVDGKVWAMGVNFYGELGDGTTVNHYIPQPVPNLVAGSLVPGGVAVHSLAIGYRVPSMQFDHLTSVYDGNHKPVTVTTTPAGQTLNITYDGSATAPINSGHYAVGVTLHAPAYDYYVTNLLVISPANATVTLTGLNHTYDGTGQSAGATTIPANLKVNLTYNGSATPPTNAGSYFLNGAVDDVNYQGNSSTSFVIQKASASVSLSNLDQKFNGTARPVSASTTPSGLLVGLTYNGSADAPTNVGTYAVVGIINDANYSGQAFGDLTVSYPPAAITANNMAISMDFPGPPGAVVIVQSASDVFFTEHVQNLQEAVIPANGLLHFYDPYPPTLVQKQFYRIIPK